jgi:hypothetical protein
MIQTPYMRMLYERWGVVTELVTGVATALACREGACVQ